MKRRELYFGVIQSRIPHLLSMSLLQALFDYGTVFHPKEDVWFSPWPWSVHHMFCTWSFPFTDLREPLSDRESVACITIFHEKAIRNNSETEQAARNFGVGIYYENTGHLGRSHDFVLWQGIISYSHSSLSSSFTFPCNGYLQVTEQ